MSLLTFFPPHLLAAVLALQFGWSLHSSPTEALARFPWRATVVTLVPGVVASVLWGTLFFPNDLDGVTSVVFLGGLFSVPALFGVVTIILVRERRMLDDAARGAGVEPSIR